MTGSTPAELSYEKELLSQYASPDTEIEVQEIEKGAASIESYFDISLGAIDLFRLIRQAHTDGIDGIVITCFGNANLDAAREISSIPVIGSGLASVSLAATICRRFSIIGTLPAVRDRFENEVWKAGLLSKLASVRTINMSVLELDNRSGSMKKAMIEEARRAIQEDGAEVIVPGCFGMIGIAKEIQEVVQVPVIEPAGAAMCLIETLVKLNIGQSKLSYPFPPPKERSYGF